MINIIETPSKNEWDNIIERPTKTVDNIESIVFDIFNKVKSKGDNAVKEFTQKFDKCSINTLSVSDDEFINAEKSISEELKNAITLAKNNIESFHKSQISSVNKIETSKGVKCWQEKRAIEKVGLYIPGGTAPLFSTVLMLTIPALIAGCKEISIVTPPRKDGSIAPETLYTAKLCGVKNVYKVGGIQAIAALTFGTETINKVYKIFGPGNQYVTVAKQLATKFNVAIDMPAGPSELLVIADDTSVPSFVASDLLSQAEHGADSQVILVTDSKKVITEVEKEIESQLENLTRKDIAKQAIANSKLILIRAKEEILNFVNLYGPEHLIICTKENDYYCSGIQNAGSVFIGNYTPESAGDYASGTNHTLPTNGFSKNYSGVNLDSYFKTITFQEISKEGIQNIGPAIEIMASAEGLQAHKNAVTLRLNENE